MYECIGTGFLIVCVAYAVRTAFDCWALRNAERRENNRMGFKP